MSADDRLFTLNQCMERLNLGGTRVGEKAKLISQIKEELETKSIIRALTKASEKNEACNWRTLLELSERLARDEYRACLKETDKATDDIELRKKLSAFALKIQCFSLYRIVCEKFAQATITEFPATAVATLCCNLLDDEIHRSIYFQDISQILLKCIFVDSARCDALTQDHFETMIQTSIAMVKMGTSSGNNCALSADLYGTVLCNFVKQYRLVVSDACSDLEEIVDKFRDTAPGIRPWESIMSCINFIVETYAYDYRSLLCRFGETIAPKIFPFYDSFSDHTLQREVARFFRLQFVLHHPNSQPEFGSSSNERWTGIVDKIYEKMRMDLSKFIKSTESSQKVGGSLLDEEIMDLACRTLLQIYMQKAPSSPEVKRARIETSWESIITSLQESQNRHNSLPWLEIIRHLFINFNQCLASETKFKLVQAVVNLMDTSKRYDVLNAALRTLRAAVGCLHTSVECQSLFQRLHERVSLFLPSAPLRKEAIELLTSLVIQNFLPCADRLVRRACGVVNLEPDRGCCNLIAATLVNCDFDERCSLDRDDGACGPNSFRLSLLNWLFSSPRLLDEEDTLNGVYSLRFSSPAQIGHILASLLCESPSRASTTRLTIATKDDHVHSIELFLMTTLWLADSSKSVESICARPQACLVGVCDKLVELLTTILVNLLNEFDKPGVSNAHFKLLVDHWCLAWCFRIIISGIVESMPPSMQRLDEQIQRAYQTLESKFSKEYSSEKTKIFLNTVDNAVGYLRQLNLQLPVTVIPVRLINVLLLLIDNEVRLMDGKHGDDHERLLLECASTVGLCFEFCQIFENSNSQLPVLCQDYLEIVGSAPMKYESQLHMMAEMAKFFGGSSGTVEIFKEFWSKLKELLNENKSINHRLVQILNFIHRVCPFVRSHYKAVGKMVLATATELISQPRPHWNVVRISAICIRILCEASETGEVDLLLLQKALGKSFYTNYELVKTMSRAVTSSSVEQLLDAYHLTFFPKTDGQDVDIRDNRKFTFCIAVGMLLERGEPFHLPCLFKMIDVVNEKAIDEEYLMKILRRFLGSAMEAVLEANQEILRLYCVNRFKELPGSLLVVVTRIPAQLHSSGTDDFAAMVQSLTLLCRRLALDNNTSQGIGIDSKQWSTEVNKLFTSKIGNLHARWSAYLVLTLRQLAFGSPYKRRWIEIVCLFCQTVDFNHFGDNRFFVVRDLMYLCSYLLMEICDLADARSCLEKLTLLCNKLHKINSFSLGCDSVIAAVVDIARRIPSLNEDASAYITGVFKYFPESSPIVACLPLVPPDMKCHSVQSNARSNMNILQLCHVISERRTCFITTDDLCYLYSHLNIEANFAFNGAKCLLKLYKKMLELTKTSDHRRLNALRLMAKIVKLFGKNNWSLFSYDWDYNKSFMETAVASLDEYLRSKNVSGIALLRFLRLIDSVSVNEKSFSFQKDYPVVQAIVTQNFHTPSVSSASPSDMTLLQPPLIKFALSLCNLGPNQNLLDKYLVLESYDITLAILPYIMEYLVNQEEFAKNINANINGILREMITGNKDPNFVHCILHCLNRLQRSELNVTGVRRYQLLNIDFLLLAEAAQLCDINYPVPLLVELAAESFRTSELDKKINITRTESSVFSTAVKSDERFGRVLLEHYLRTNDTESMECLGDLVADSPEAEYLRCIKGDSISKLISMYATCKNLKVSMPWHIFSVDYLFADQPDNDLHRDARFECAWKIGQWDSLDVSKMRDKKRSFNQLLFDAVKSYENDFSGRRQTLWNCVGGNISGYPFDTNHLEKLIIADELESMSENDISFYFESIAKSHYQLDNLDWLQFSLAHRFLNTSILPTRKVAIAKIFADLCCRQLTLCRQKKMFETGLKLAGDAEKLLSRFVDDEPNVSSASVIVQLQKIELLWAFDEKTKASRLLKSLTSSLEQTKHCDPEMLCCLSKCLVMLGEFQRLSGCLESSRAAYKEHFSQAVEILQNSSCRRSSTEIASTLGSAYLALAQFANRQYQELSDYINSSTFTSKQSHIEKLKSHLNDSIPSRRSSAASPMASVQEKRYAQLSKLKGEVDEREVKELLDEQSQHLLTALTMYTHVLRLCDDHDVIIFRIVSLWFDGGHVEEASEIIDKLLPSISSYKWLPVIRQITSRLADSACSRAICNIIRIALADHPYHTFHIVNPLIITEPKDDTETKRRKAATELVKSAAKHSTETMKCLGQLFKAFVELDGWKPDQKSKRYEIPWNQKLLSFNGRVPLPTMTIPVNISGKYDNVPTIQKFLKKVQIMSGLSAPKLVTCLCSDGIERRVLVKGALNDDPRQDAIIEQVFSIVNLLLSKTERETNSQHQFGCMRTYNVVPLTSISGLIEFCEGCISFGDYLVSAHKQYHPDEQPAAYFRQRLQEVAKEGIETRRNLFMSISTLMKPVFRHFFFERFTEPDDWCRKRKTYTISLAVSCLVGHIIGLSDRHVQNILIDEQTAELVQIDHGMAFEQGRLLPTPETVPFRLTREIIDPIGIGGLNGLFRNSCVRTLSVLRESRDILLPILSVLLQDPISQWVLTASKAQRKQPDVLNSSAKSHFDISKNIHAERAILRVVDKLNGREQTELLTVEGQVSHLVNAARDAKNLSLMYSGWQPYF